MPLSFEGLRAWGMRSGVGWVIALIIAGMAGWLVWSTIVTLQTPDISLPASAGQLNTELLQEINAARLERLQATPIPWQNLVP
jgi:hypothetical protein